MYFDKPYNRTIFLNLLQSKMFPNFVRKEEHLWFWNKTTYFVENWIYKLWTVNLDKEITILEIEQKSSNDPRITLTKDAFKILEHHGIDHAIVIFHCKDATSYRLSLLTVSYENWEKKTSSYKRYSFIVWPNEKVRTVNQQLINKWQIKNYEDLISRFDVEVVRKEFFETYLELFVRLYKAIQDDKPFVELLSSQNVDIVSFTKNLLWKIIFLYFVQQKWWLWLWNNTSLEYWKWDKDFMRKLWNNFNNQWESLCTHEKTWYFYNDYLEWLFFAWLNVDRRNNDDWFEQLQMKVPYLNWWLFKEEYEWWQNNVARVSNSIFSNIDEKWDDADWILDIFDRYNFTIDEDSLYDTDIAVDPEMLWRIFEKMISISTDNIKNVLEIYDNKKKNSKFDFWKDLNKQLWAFYTPREVVHYMTKESLILYLQYKTNLSESNIRILFDLKEKFLLSSEDMKKAEYSTENLMEIWNNIIDVDNALKNIKILDPAVWSWAFPMWLLHEISSLRYYMYGVFYKIFENKIKEYKNKDWKISLYKIKKEIILNNIHWIDIDPWAIDIAKLRFWLSLVVDEESPEPLPNFEFKFICATSTIYLEKWSLFTKQETINKLVDLRKEYYKCDDEWKKKKLRNLFSSLKSELTWFWKDRSEFKTTKEWQDHCYNLNLDKRNRQILEWNPFNLKTFNPRFDPEIMFWTKDFDIVIWNPPYIKEYDNRDAFNWFRENSPYYIWKMDLWYWFACYWIDLLKDHWILCFIAQNNRTTSAWAKIMRNKVIKDTLIKQMVDFNTYMVFENASIQTMVMLFEKSKEKAEYSFDLRSLKDWSTKEDMLKILDRINSQKIKYLNPTIVRDKYINSLLTFSEDDSFLNKIYEGKIFFKDDEVAQWIVFPQDFIDKKRKEIMWPEFNIWDWIFALSDLEYKKLNLSEDEKKLIKPLFTTDQIKKYYTDKWNKFWLIYTWSKFKNPNSMDNYPKLKLHLDKFQKIITSDNKPYWLHRARQQHFFESDKIISLRKCPEWPCFSYSNFDCYVTQTFFIIQSRRRNMKFLTWLLNSKLIAFRLKNKGKMQWNNYQIDKEPLQWIPLLNMKWDNSVIVTLVDKILNIKSKNIDADISDLEREIDKEVYNLYELTDEEIQIVEESAK